MKRPVLLACLILSGFAWAPLAAAQPRPADICAVPPDLIADTVKLSKLGARLKAGSPVTIVAIGGASTAGQAAGNDPNNAYPHQLELALQRRFPQSSIAVVNRGVPRQTAAEMAARFQADVFASNPALVIWELGTVDAVRGTDVEDFAAAVQAGIDQIRGHGADPILVDMQYNPRTSSIINFEPYLETLHRTADLEEVYLFRRYDIMHHWSDAGQFDLVGVPAGKQAALAGEIYHCLGERMADAIVRAAR